MDIRRCLFTALFLAAVACERSAPTEPATAQAGVLSRQTDATTVSSRPAPRALAPRGSGVALAAGAWGGDQAGLTVTSGGATARFFCAHGAIEQPILTDSSGRFEAGGYYVFEGGPTPVDDTPFRQPAIYTGSTDGKTMTLTVTLPKQSQKLGPFILLFGQSTTLRPCPIV